MTQEALKRIELIFQTEIKILKYPYPGLSHFCLRSPRQFLRDFFAAPNCLEGLERLDFMRVGGLPRVGNNNLRMVYLCILILAYEDSSMRLLKRIKHIAYDESQPLAYLSRQAVPEEFRGCYEDKQLRKLLVEFFHLVANRRSANKVIRFLESHPILDFAFQLLFKRLFYGRTPNNELFSTEIQTVDLIAVLFEKLELKPDISNRRMRIGEYRYLAEDDFYTYMTYHRQDDLDIDFTQEDMSSSDSEEESYTTRTTMKVDSMKESHCGSNQTKVTEEEDPGRWSTPVKHEVPMSHSMIPNRETMQAEVTLRQFKGSAVFDSKNNKTIGGLEQYESRCGQIKDKLRKLESDVELYNKPSEKIKDEKEEGTINGKIFPLCFKERQSERKSSEHFDTSFFQEKGKNSAVRPSCNQTSTFIRSGDLPPRPPPKIETKSSKELLKETSVFRMSSTLELANHSHHRTNSMDDQNPKGGSSSLLLKVNPKKIMVRKI